MKCVQLERGTGGPRENICAFMSRHNCFATGTNKNVAVLNTIQGWRGYGGASLSFALDQSSHINLSTVYKRGSAPPTFDKVDVVQTRITIKY